MNELESHNEDMAQQLNELENRNKNMTHGQGTCIAHISVCIVNCKTPRSPSGIVKHLCYPLSSI